MQILLALATAVLSPLGGEPVFPPHSLLCRHPGRGRPEKELRPNIESIRFHYDMAALDDPRAKQFSEKEFWDASLVEKIRRSGFVEQLYKK